MKRKLSILLCIFMGLSFNTLRANATTQENAKPELAVKANNEDNSISLKWEMGNTDKKYSYPTLKLTPSTTDTVKDKVTIKAEGSSLSKEIVKIITPDGKEVSGSEASYDVDVNGTYTFKAVDSDGNEVTESIDIQNIVPDVILNVEPDMNKVHLEEKLVVDLTIDHVTDIGGVDVRVKYDASKLKLLGFTQVPGVSYYVKNLGEGDMRITFISSSLATFVKNKESLLKMNFEGVAPGEALIDITKGRISDGISIKKVLRDAECGQTIINICNRKLKPITLLDITMISRHVGEDPEKLLPDMDLDLNLDGKIDQADIDKAYKLMLENPEEDI